MSTAADASVETSIVLTVSCPPLFVVICFVISFLGCYTATQLTEQIRISQSQPSRLIGSKTMFLLHSLAFGGVSAWIMHILSLATSVLTLPNQASMNIDITFATGMTSVSLLLVLTTTVIGNNTHLIEHILSLNLTYSPPLPIPIYYSTNSHIFHHLIGTYVASRDRWFYKTKVEIAAGMADVSKVITPSQLIPYHPLSSLFVINILISYYLIIFLPPRIIILICSVPLLSSMSPY